MNEVFEKIKQKLGYEVIALEDNYGDLVECIPLKVVFEIVDQVAEEHAKESVEGDLISKSALIEEINKRSKDITSEWETAGILNLIYKQPTFDEKEIIRKPMERIVEKLEEANPIQFNSFSKPLITVEDALKIVKEEGAV